LSVLLPTAVMCCADELKGCMKQHQASLVDSGKCCFTSHC